MRPSLLPLAVCIAFAGPAFAAAAPASTPTDPQLQALDARIRALETEAQKLREQAAQALAAANDARAELDKMKAAQAAQPAPAPAQQAAAVAAVSAPPEASAPSSGGANGNAFNPAIAVILNGNYAHHSLDPDQLRARRISRSSNGTGPGLQGLSLGESEISFAANIDDKFYGQLTICVRRRQRQRRHRASKRRTSIR